MRVGIYGRPNCHELEALESGFRAEGHAVVQRSASDYTKNETEPFDLVAVSSLRGKNSLVLSDYRAKGVEVLVLDFGYLRRTNHASDPGGYFQVSRNGLSVLPQFDCPADRFAALGFEIPRDPHGNGDAVLILGQVPGDASHSMALDALAAWYGELAARIRSTTERPILFRPHPLAPEVTCDGAERASGTLAEDLARAHVAVAHSSTACFEALLAGVPVCVFSGPCAEDQDLAAGEMPAPWFPVGAEAASFFARVAYGQWTIDELASGEAVRFALSDGSQFAPESLIFEDPEPAATLPIELLQAAKPDPVNPDEFSKPELVKLAKRHGVDPVGTKAEIVARINARLAA